MTWHSWDWKEPSMGETDCARMKATGYGMWEDFNCDDATNMWAFCMRAKCKYQVSFNCSRTPLLSSLILKFIYHVYKKLCPVYSQNKLVDPGNKQVKGQCPWPSVLNIKFKDERLLCTYLTIHVTLCFIYHVYQEKTIFSCYHHNYTPLQKKNRNISFRSPHDPSLGSATPRVKKVITCISRGSFKKTTPFNNFLPPMRSLTPTWGPGISGKKCCILFWGESII